MIQEEYAHLNYDLTPNVAKLFAQLNPEMTFRQRGNYDIHGSLQYTTLHRRAARDLHASRDRAARRAQAKPLDVVHLSPNQRPWNQRDGTEIRDLLARRGEGLSRSP